MPNISFSFRDFQQLLGKKLSIGEFKDLVALYAKGEVEGFENDEVKVALDDTNMPYLWCAEGMARFFRGVLGKEKGLAEIKVGRGNYEIVVDKSVKAIRPHIAAFVAEGREIDEYLLKQLIQLQDKMDEGYGRKRKHLSIGVYSHRNIAFPVRYTAVDPKGISFVPLEMAQKLTPAQILKMHPKGRQYGWILGSFSRYPLLIDSRREVLSLVPITNSDFTGKLRVGDKELLFEATGIDSEAVNLAANIFAQNLFERGFKITAVKIKDSKSFTTPVDFNEKMRISREDVESRIGIKLSASRLRQLLEKARYGVSGNIVTVPNYRADILHKFDIVEDVAIMYGFDRIEGIPLTSYTAGSPAGMSVFVDKIREIVCGLGFQEILSPVLSSRKVLEGNMGISGSGVVEIDNFMSETFSAVRNWLSPILMEVLSKNKHNDFPQKIFEQGTVNIRKGNVIEDKEHIALASSHTNSGFTEAKQYLDALFSSLNLRYSIQPHDSAVFIKGRGGRVKAGGVDIGIIGEVSPEVLLNWGLELPAVLLELDLTALNNIIS
ncbi:phenylalanine--tRNA ligase subunit beta [Candidatus Woesearchaeota archaeon]|nr:phenylalanine--tRNA ligase subunit beta [Candidatus Woesearchaeota archaeon]